MRLYRHTSSFSVGRGDEEKVATAAARRRCSQGGPGRAAADSGVKVDRAGTSRGTRPGLRASGPILPVRSGVPAPRWRRSGIRRHPIASRRGGWDVRGRDGHPTGGLRSQYDCDNRNRRQRLHLRGPGHRRGRPRGHPLAGPTREAECHGPGLLVRPPSGHGGHRVPSGHPSGGDRGSRAPLLGRAGSGRHVRDDRGVRIGRRHSGQWCLPVDGGPGTIGPGRDPPPAGLGQRRGRLPVAGHRRRARLLHRWRGRPHCGMRHPAGECRSTLLGA